MENIHKRIFKKGSKTYFTSSIFFPQKAKEAVFKLYAFVRVADDFVDNIPPQIDGFYSFVNKYRNKDLTDPIIKGLYEVKEEYGITDEEIESFLDAMESDTSSPVTYETYADLQKYMYGSAEVIGLMMARIMNLPEKSFPFAQKLGEAMQYINFLRDINEDNSLNRTYIPKNVYTQYKLQSLKQEHVLNNQEAFIEMMQAEIKRYLKVQEIAEHGFHYIPYRYLIPIKTASDMYKWTAHQIYKKPLIVFEKKVKPSKIRIVTTILINSLTIPFLYVRRTITPHPKA